MLKQLIGIEESAITQNIIEESPSGEDPRTDTSPASVYFNLKDVRNSARALERSALVDNEPLLAFAHEWDPIIEQVPQVLATQCKDLELTAWLIEALVRRFGFKGLTCGFNIARNLIEHHWETVYPLPDEDGLETRIAPLIGLNGFDGEGTLLMPIACIPLTECNTEQAYSLWEFEQACEVERLEEAKRNQRYQAGAVKLEEIQASVDASAPNFFAEAIDDVDHALESYTQMIAALDKFSGAPQPSSHIEKRLLACKEAMLFLAQNKLAQCELEAATEQASSTVVQEEHSPSQPKAAPQLTDRNEAIDELKKIARFFKATEPHSPMAYAIEQVVRWSDLALPDLLQELIVDNDARAGYFRLTGINQKHQE
ncbi:type VI secretion system protein TssA [Vibrio sp. SCSIO 43136]|uniref:type VI secretion system protein TssA n=1 Tax=Vibrio sp. SCSIO 43136 TaxID=2819101 RepID=UPI002075D262|nr:type VI secretion system protein TssA [Vibrio sp. SCSIO 43136]USD67510.1 type VI secretion system protein TssA [Vibrio sp. SCSIO 43136]